MWGEATGAEPALTLAPKCKGFSCWSRGEPDVGEVGKDGLLKRRQVSKDVPDGRDDGDGDEDDDDEVGE